MCGAAMFNGMSRVQDARAAAGRPTTLSPSASPMFAAVYAAIQKKRAATANVGKAAAAALTTGQSSLGNAAPLGG